MLVNPYSAREIAKAICRVLGDEGLRRELAGRGLERARMFTWRSVEEHVRVYRAVAER